MSLHFRPLDDIWKTNCPVTINVGSLITHNRPSNDTSVPLLCIIATLENTQLVGLHTANKQSIFYSQFRSCNLSVASIVKIERSKCRPCARIQPLSPFLHSSTAESACCRPFQISTRRCFSSLTLFTRPS